MPVLKKSDPLPERPVIIFIYGEPGIGKTSLFNTAAKPLLLDFDRGKDRAVFRQDTLVVNRWEDVEAEEKAGTYKEYSTIGIDTAKSALDDFLMAYVVEKDFVAKKNKLKAYGAIGDEFKIFVSNRRAESADIVVIAHAKDEKEGDITRKLPDVTGGSYQLLMRIADQVGYMSTRNNKRTICFEPTDTNVGKNVARLPIIEVPDQTDPKFPTFLAGIIASTKAAICSLSEAQKEAMEKSERYQKEIEAVNGPAELSLLFAPVMELQSKALRAALLQKMSEKQKANGWVWDDKQKCFFDPNAKKEEEPSSKPVAEELPFRQ
ncbi:ATP-binding protein [Chitinophaga sp. YIM B06452]|uniref:ATP-binding protein n=1 Tax=Chitinophaga sp. YIM B06452 TaxID=3082158 RepID=UPI0031FF17EE